MKQNDEPRQVKEIALLSEQKGDFPPFPRLFPSSFSFLRQK
jgi:hypothetical protein